MMTEVGMLDCEVIRNIHHIICENFQKETIVVCKTGYFEFKTALTSIVVQTLLFLLLASTESRCRRAYILPLWFFFFFFSTPNFGDH